ncbi:hypothetical protein [Kribbella sp.]|uniref:hypothetical protein n=1 Tax=Kribbella sp. TaxID=1871183 RepID=UPI002D49550C|nr:hypothetical protein [Kribbella sp.]HZX07967.1 hypothetical protein [Kribbella sp.]
MSSQGLPARRSARGIDLWSAEWIKFWSLRSTPIGLMLGTALSLYLAVDNSRRGILPLTGSHGPLTPEQAAFDGFSWLPAMLGAGLLGTQFVVGEYASGLIRTTFTAVPDRRRVGAAKIALLSALTGAGALVVAACGLVIALNVVPQPNPAGTQPLRAVLASVLALPTCALIGMALGALLRDAAGAGIGVCALLGFVPIMVRPNSNHCLTHVANALPYYSWGRLTAGTGARGTMPVGTAWATLAAWVAGSVFVIVVTLDRRDV